MVPADASTSMGRDHDVPWLPDDVNHSWPGLSASVERLVGNAMYRTSRTPFGWATSGADTAPPSGKLGEIGRRVVQVLPSSLERCTTALRSPWVYEQDPPGGQLNLTSEKLGP